MKTETSENNTSKTGIDQFNVSFYSKEVMKTDTVETPENLKNWMILDNGSTLHLMGNKVLLKDLRKCNEYTRIHFGD